MRNQHKEYKPKANLEFRAWLTLNDINLSQLAEAVPISLSQLSHWLATPLSDETRTELRQAALKIIVLREQDERELKGERYEKVASGH